MPDHKDEIIITYFCKDEPGLIHQITSIVSNLGVNIVDIDQFITRGIFGIILVCDLSTSKINKDECFKKIKNDLENLNEKTGGYYLIDHNILGDNNRIVPENHAKITVLGADAPGIVAKISEITAKHHVNIDSISMISREDIFAMELIVSYHVSPDSFLDFKKEIKNSIDKLGLSVIVQENDIFNEEKKLVVFDMDSTLIRQECIDEIGQALNIKDKIAKITTNAMEGKTDFKDALLQRVKLLKGLPIDALKLIAENLTLTPGAKELITSLKKMGYKVALISGGFSFFTDIIKEKLGLDYAFGNKLKIKNGKLTGEVDENFIIDGEQKAKIQKWLAKVEKISPNNIISIGDGANDIVMIKTSGLGIGFQPKKILKNVADGIMNEDNMLGIIYALGDIKKKRYKLN
ncbi:MAG: phosphoserine phosphatase SerB [Promethearchaeota archaeon]